MYTEKIRKSDNQVLIYDNNNELIDCYNIGVDGNGKEYYKPKNLNNKSGIFADRPKDALECVKNGLGDCIESLKILNLDLLYVIRYIDREYGEKIRQETLENWKNVEFVYGIKFFSNTISTGGMFIMKNNMLKTSFDDFEDILTFKTEKDAMFFIEETNKIINQHYREYSDLIKTGDFAYDYKYITTPFLNNLKCKYKKCSVFVEAFSNLLWDDAYEIRMVQLIA